VPKIRIPKRDLGIMARLHAGMSLAQVETALHMKLVNSQIKASGLVKYSRRPGNMDSDRYTSWILGFSFGQKGLESIDISAD